jgi:hypothetical protein
LKSLWVKIKMPGRDGIVMDSVVNDHCRLLKPNTQTAEQTAIRVVGR